VASSASTGDNMASTSLTGGSVAPAFGPVASASLSARISVAPTAVPVASTSSAAPTAVCRCDCHM